MLQRRIFGSVLAFLLGVGCGPADVATPGVRTGASAQPLAGSPSVRGCRPSAGATAAPTDVAIACDLLLVGSGVDMTTLPGNVVLTRKADGVPMAGFPGTSGGRDSITFTPDRDLAPSTDYEFTVSSGVKDEAGNAFTAFRLEFRTGTQPSIPLSRYPYSKTLFAQQGEVCMSLTLGPDNRLYCSTMDGKVHRWSLEAAGTPRSCEAVAGSRETYANPAWAGRAISGMVFRPLPSGTMYRELWLSHNAPVSDDALDFTGRISRLTWPASIPWTVTSESYVQELPRSKRDHLSNSLAFGPDGALYLSQGSNTAMGAPQLDGWGNRPERQLSAAILRIDITRQDGPFLVKTQDAGGSYDPFAAGAPVTLWATGVRNAYDLVWHSNGQLYAPTNGSAAGGDTPGGGTGNCSSAPRIDGGPTQPDFLFRVVKGGYYGHPNPVRNECILNGGNPDSNVNPAEVVGDGVYAGYPVGTQPDPGYRGFIFNFGKNVSPNGAVEYLSGAHSGGLRNKLLVVRWSAGDDVLILPAPTTGQVSSSEVFRLQTTRFVNPIDITQSTSTGCIWVSEMIPTPEGGYTGRLQVLKPVQ
ncbi:MAG TPA: Ig-like domain-containing protein [Myxococcus sp.]|nr:Ig-like domain-containing protein [Myxococcus sp.]